MCGLLKILPRSGNTRPVSGLFKDVRQKGADEARECSRHCQHSKKVRRLARRYGQSQFLGHHTKFRHQFRIKSGVLRIPVLKHLTFCRAGEGVSLRLFVGDLQFLRGNLRQVEVNQNLQHKDIFWMKISNLYGRKSVPREAYQGADKFRMPCSL